jgi:predicted nucleic acid-binding protein
MNDTWIAALAREHALPVLSNGTHFDAVRDVRRMGWRSSPRSLDGAARDVGK